MANKASDVRFQVSENDLTEPTSSQKYPLGTIFECVDSSQKDAIKRFMYVKSGAALTAYQPYRITFVDTAAGEVTTTNPVAVSSAIAHICVPQVAFTSGYYGFVQIAGQATVKIGAFTYATGDPLAAQFGSSTFVINGTSGVPLVDEYTAAICQQSGSAAANIQAFLIGDRVQVS